MFKPGDLIASKNKPVAPRGKIGRGARIKYIILGTKDAYESGYIGDIDIEAYELWCIISKQIKTISSEYINDKFKKIGVRKIDMYKTLYTGDQTIYAGATTGRFSVTNSRHGYSIKRKL